MGRQDVMALRNAGLHHVTAICGPIQRSADFYADTLGLRLVKRTVNFDDPGTYHLYFGDRVGRPGTIMTFFPWESAPAGRAGVGTSTVTAFEVPAASLSWWLDRLSEKSVAFDPPRRRFGAMVVSFKDPDGMSLEVEASPDPTSGLDVWSGGAVGEEHAVRGFRGVTLPVPDPESTARFLTESLAFELAGEDADRLRLAALAGSPGRYVDLIPLRQRSAGWMGTGVVHHVAFRARDEAEQRSWRELLLSQGLEVTEVLDRSYFRSIYFRHGALTGGILFEIATDGPGFSVDEPESELGKTLKLPGWLEPRRAGIEEALPPLRTS
jgi:glyoxalase family protein